MSTGNLHQWLLVFFDDDIEVFRPAHDIFTQPEKDMQTYADTIHEVANTDAWLVLTISNGKMDRAYMDISLQIGWIGCFRKYRVIWDLGKETCQIFDMTSGRQLVRDKKLYKELQARIGFVVGMMDHRYLGCRRRLKQILVSADYPASKKPKVVKDQPLLRSKHHMPGAITAAQAVTA